MLAISDELTVLRSIAVLRKCALCRVRYAVSASPRGLNSGTGRFSTTCLFHIIEGALSYQSGLDSPGRRGANGLKRALGRASPLIVS
jgi:hypothetical protein